MQAHDCAKRDEADPDHEEQFGPERAPGYALVLAHLIINPSLKDK